MVGLLALVFPKRRTSHKFMHVRKKQHFEDEEKTPTYTSKKLCP